MSIAIKRQLMVFDAADIDAESRFWAGVLGGEVKADDDWHVVMVDDEPRIAVQLAPEHRSPNWPDGDPQQLHLDLWVDDIESSQTEVLRLGAGLLQEETDSDAPDAFRVYADPAGHPFCLCWVKRSA